jgi:hypothetical protein
MDGITSPGIPGFQEQLSLILLFIFITEHFENF